MNKIEQTKKIINLTQLAIQEIDKLIKETKYNDLIVLWKIKDDNMTNIEVLDSLIEKWS